MWRTSLLMHEVIQAVCEWLLHLQGCLTISYYQSSKRPHKSQHWTFREFSVHEEHSCRCTRQCMNYCTCSLTMSYQSSERSHTGQHWTWAFDVISGVKVHVKVVHDNDMENIPAEENSGNFYRTFIVARNISMTRFIRSNKGQHWSNCYGCGGTIPVVSNGSKHSLEWSH